MSDLTFLTAEQVWGPNQLDVIRIRGAEAEIEDYAVLAGGNFDQNKYSILREKNWKILD